MKKSTNKRIFNTLLDSKFKFFILGLLSEKYSKYDRRTNIFLSLTSSSSIAAWAIWKELDLLWGLIIAISQVVYVIKPYFPYSKYSKEFYQKSILLQGLLIQFENLYYKIQNQLIPDENAIGEFFKLRQEIEKIINFQDDIIFNVNDNLKEKANHRMKIYIKKNYNITLSNQHKIT